MANRVISDKPLRDFRNLHPDAEMPLRAWYRTARTADWEKPEDVRAVYSDVDEVGKFTVFNIGGNKGASIAGTSKPWRVTSSSAWRSSSATDRQTTGLSPCQTTSSQSRIRAAP
jgi:mRNA-degrading endonuclease HigB of HigAB toxin-antitoxin module